MIKANELRLGNYIKDELGIKHKVIDFKQESYRYNLSNGKIMEKYLTDSRGIPLTEQWLLDFGFEKVSDNSFSINILRFGSIQAYKNIIDSSINIEICQQQGYTLGGTKTNHVHQLQNLYFALTGEELTLKK